jgi:hypothetical protein
MTAEASSFRRRVFVVMPFGKKEVPKKPRIDLPPGTKGPDETLQVDFDAVYEKLFVLRSRPRAFSPFGLPNKPEMPIKSASDSL